MLVVQVLYVDKLPAGFRDLAQFRKLFSTIVNPPYCQVSVTFADILSFTFLDISHHDTCTCLPPLQHRVSPDCSPPSLYNIPRHGDTVSTHFLACNTVPVLQYHLYHCPHSVLLQIAQKHGVLQDWGLVEYTSAEEAEATMETLRGARLDTEEVRVQYCIPNIHAINIYMNFVNNPMER